MAGAVDLFFPEEQALRNLADDCEGALLVFKHASETPLRDIRNYVAQITRKNKQFIRRYHRPLYQGFEAFSNVGVESALDYVLDAYDDLMGIAQDARGLEQQNLSKEVLDKEVEWLREVAADTLYTRLIFPEDFNISDLNDMA